MAKYIVTGSEGFIGKALVAFLVAGGHEVIGIDRKNGDEASDIGKFLVTDDRPVAGVFHLAAQTSVFNPEIEQIRKDNIDTFITVCNQCSYAGIRLVYASSSTAAPGNTASASVSTSSTHASTTMTLGACVSTTSTALTRVGGLYFGI